MFGEKGGSSRKNRSRKKVWRRGRGVSKDLAANDFWLKVGILDFCSFLGPGTQTGRSGVSLSRAAILSGRLLTILTMICRIPVGLC